MDWINLEEQLQTRVEDVCRHLLPNGRREGREWVVGNLAGEAGNSLKINVAGKLGIWRDFASNEGGKSLLSLWLKVRNLPKFGAAMDEAKQFLGITDDYQTRFKQPPAPASMANAPDDSAWKAVADTWAKCAPLVEGGPVWQYLVEKRKLGPAALVALDVRELYSNGQWTIVFPYYAAPCDEKPAVPLGQPRPEWLKFELLERPGGKKKEWTTKQPEKSLFGVQLWEHPLFAKCQDVLLCEGEKEVLAFATYGCNAWGMF
jgi:twinkle protein